MVEPSGRLLAEYVTSGVGQREKQMFFGLFFLEKCFGGFAENMYLCKLFLRCGFGVGFGIGCGMGFYPKNHTK